jgi:hypothetical protein
LRGGNMEGAGQIRAIACENARGEARCLDEKEAKDTHRDRGHRRSCRVVEVREAERSIFKRQPDEGRFGLESR